MTNLRTMLFHRCNSVYYEKTSKKIEVARAADPKRGQNDDKTPRFVFDK